MNNLTRRGSFFLNQEAEGARGDNAAPRHNGPVCPCMCVCVGRRGGSTVESGGRWDISTLLLVKIANF